MSKDIDKKEFEPEVRMYLLKRLVYFVVCLLFTLVITVLFKTLSLSIGFLCLSLGLLAWWQISTRNFKKNKYLILEGKFKEIRTTQDDDKKNKISRGLFSGYGRTDIIITTYSDRFNDEGKQEELIVAAPVRYGFEAGENSVIRIYFTEDSMHKQNNNTYYINSPLIVYCVEN